MKSSDQQTITHSFYTLEEELRRGYITIEGGHRVGLAGKVILEGGVVKGIRNLSSFNIRIASQKLGIAEPLIPYLYRRGMETYNDHWFPSDREDHPADGILARMISTEIPENGSHHSRWELSMNDPKLPGA